MEFTLSNEKKRWVLTNRLDRIQLDAYQYELMRLVAIEVGDQQQEADAITSIERLEAELSVYVVEIDALKSEEDLVLGDLEPIGPSAVGPQQAEMLAVE